MAVTIPSIDFGDQLDLNTRTEWDLSHAECAVRLEIMNWLKEPKAQFPPQVDRDSVGDGGSTRL
jgi:hypothetical protein